MPSNARWAQNGITVAGSPNGTSGSSSDRLNANFGIYFADDDILYIADLRNGRIVLIAPNSTTAIRVTSQVFPSNPLKGACNVFVTRTSIYVLDTWDFSVQKWSRNFSGSVTVAGVSAVKGNATNMMTFSNSYHLFVDNYGNLFVSDYDNHRVMRFSWNSTSGASGVMVAGTGIPGFDTTQLNGPKGIFVTDDGILYIADSINHRIQKWIIGSTSGMTVAGTRQAGRESTQFAYPQTVLVDLNGYMYIADYRNSRVMRWKLGASAGECIVACSGYWGVASSQLNGPTSITFDSRGSIYVNEFDNSRVQKFEILDETSMLSIY